MADLQKSNSLLSALRQKNMVLYEKSQACESWKLKALMKIVSNAFVTRESYSGMSGGQVNEKCNLYLDGLQYHSLPMPHALPQSPSTHTLPAYM